MLIALLYHKTGLGKYRNPIEVLKIHFQWIASHFTSVLPGDPLSGLSVCLTFDDAFFDFYYHIFPLLKKYGLKALLAVPTGYILHNTFLSAKSRLKKQVPSFTTHNPQPSPAFCTWLELNEMAQSSFIQIASHSITHQPMTALGVNIEEELTCSKWILEKQLGVPIPSFVYPFGIWNKQVHALAKQEYQYIFRIGNAENVSWSNRNQLIYRINGDQLPSPTFPFTPCVRLMHVIRFFFNVCRGR